MRLMFAVLALGVGLVPSALSAEEFRYRGICDASAAVALDANHFIVADDEKDTLRIYRFGVPIAVGRVRLEDYLDNDDDDEADLEGAARIGDTIYWIASHSKNKKQRRRLFATTVVEEEDPPTVEPLSSPPYKKLIKNLIKDPKFAELNLADAAAKEDAEVEGALNIEGLAATSEGHLLIGFRNPLTGAKTDKKEDRKAIVISLINPRAVIERRKKPQFGNRILLKLDGRGIRSIDQIGDHYLIIAGPIDNGEGNSNDFALYRWDGQSEVPTQINADFGTLNPEAMFPIPGKKEVMILSDDGGVDGVKCKKAPKEKRSFRSITLPLR